MCTEANNLEEVEAAEDAVVVVSFNVLQPNLSDCHAHDAYENGKRKSSLSDIALLTTLSH